MKNGIWHPADFDGKNAGEEKTKEKEKTKEQVVTGVMQGVDAYDTAVVLMYDVADKPMTVKALPSIIKQIKAKNYELLPVDESMILIQHNNGNQEEGK